MRQFPSEIVPIVEAPQSGRGADWRTGDFSPPRILADDSGDSHPPFANRYHDRDSREDASIGGEVLLQVSHQFLSAMLEGF